MSLRQNKQNDLIAVEELSLLATNAQQNDCSVCFVAAKNDLVQISLQLVGSAGVLALNSEHIYAYYRNLAKRPELDDFLNKTENGFGSQLLAIRTAIKAYKINGQQLGESDQQKVKDLIATAIQVIKNITFVVNQTIIDAQNKSDNEKLVVKSKAQNVLIIIYKILVPLIQEINCLQSLLLNGSNQVLTEITNLFLQLQQQKKF
jgi:hypothetical protein